MNILFLILVVGICLAILIVDQHERKKKND